MILTDTAICEAIQQQKLIITPWNDAQLNSNSYDVTLSPLLLVPRMAPMLYEIAFVEPPVQLLQQTQMESQQHVIRPSPNNYQFQDTYLDLKREDQDYLEVTIPEKGLILFPGVLYLGCTNEYTENPVFVPEIRGKSSLGRLGVQVHQTAGFGDLGFKGHWTLEISVIHPVRVYPNIRFAQLAFYQPAGVVTQLYDKKPGSKYSDQPAKPVASAYYRNFEKTK